MFLSGKEFQKAVKDALNIEIDDNQVSVDLRVGESLKLRQWHTHNVLTLESVKVPNNLIAMVDGRSSFARLGLSVCNAAMIKPGFSGRIAMELFNQSIDSVEIARGTPIFQLYFIQISSPVDVPSRYKGQESAEALVGTERKPMDGLTGPDLWDSILPEPTESQCPAQHQLKSWIPTSKFSFSDHPPITKEQTAFMDDIQEKLEIVTEVLKRESEEVRRKQIYDGFYPSMSEMWAKGEKQETLSKPNNSESASTPRGSR